MVGKTDGVASSVVEHFRDHERGTGLDPPQLTTKSTKQKESSVLSGAVIGDKTAYIYDNIDKQCLLNLCLLVLCICVYI